MSQTQFNNDANEFNERGMSRAKLGDFEGAIKDYDQAIRMNCNFAEAYYNRGIARTNLGDLEDAIEDYDEAGETRGGDTSSSRKAKKAS